jgi:uncharacterized membrane protein affecting hemolysin expression
MSDNITSQSAQISFSPVLPIPDHLVGEIQSKLAYVDEAIARASIGPSSTSQEIITSQSITLALRQRLSLDQQSLLEEKVQRVVESMVKGAIKPKIQVLEDHLDRPILYQADPMEELA